MKFQKPKGTRDFYPEEQEARNRIFNIFRNIAKNYGFLEVESPAFENLNLLIAKSGGEIKEQIFALEERGKEKFGLRFDLTVPLTRMFIEKQKELAKPVKWFYITKMWRYENPQSGRVREFYNFGVELFGSNKPEADAEIISLAIDALLALGLKKNDFVVKINNRKLLQGLLSNLKINKIEEVLRVIDKSKKITKQEFEKELRKLKLNEKQIKELNKILTIRDLNQIKVKEAQEGVSELKEIFKILRLYRKDKFVELDLSVARGLAYYTGTVFECFDAKEKLRSIFAGGRYDNLIEKLGGQNCPATGFGLGDVTLELLLKQKNLWPKFDLSLDYYIILVNKDMFKEGIKIANKLREKYKVDIDLTQRSLTKQLEYANAIKAKNVVIIGPKELAKKKVKIKDMKTGKEKLVKVGLL